MISAVAEMYNIHPQTLRLYEREGLLVPSRTNGNTRLYGDEDLERLETILNLARDLGVNLAGIEIILNMRPHAEDAGGDAGFRRVCAEGDLEPSAPGPGGHPECLGAPRAALFDPNPYRNEVRGIGKPKPRIPNPPSAV